MKKLWVVIGLAVTICACQEAEQKAQEPAKNSDWVSQNLKGMVKQIETVSYTPDSTGAIAAPDSCCVELEDYDENGYTTAFNSKTQAGIASNAMRMERYEGGKWKQMVNMKDGKVMNTFKISLDEKGMYTSAENFDSSGTLTAFYNQLTEDEYNAVTGGKEYNTDSSLKSSFVAVYKNGMQISNVSKDSTGKVTYEINHELNDKGDIVKSTTNMVEKDSATVKVTTYTYDSYDETGNWTQRTTYDDKGKATKVQKRNITYFTKE